MRNGSGLKAAGYVDENTTVKIIIIAKYMEQNNKLLLQIEKEVYDYTDWKGLWN